mmetsp:Transcript_8845/g.28034  ORF Transcript_8845/g.28034 Transcript_8845/m.28034 type:complete len:537 (+) Transcript_8845:4514-6124(+)
MLLAAHRRHARLCAQLIGAAAPVRLEVEAGHAAAGVVEAARLPAWGQRRDRKRVPVHARASQRDVPAARLLCKGARLGQRRSIRSAGVHPLLPEQSLRADAPDVPKAGAALGAASAGAIGGPLAARHALVVLLVVRLVLAAALGVEVLQLREVLPARDERRQRGRVLANAIPRPGRVAPPVGGVRHPLLRLERDAPHLEDANLPVPRGEDVLEEGLVGGDPALAVHRELVEQALLHHRRGLPALVEAKLGARRVARADVAEDRVADAGHVRRLCKVVASAARPDEHVVGEVARVRVRLLLWRREDAAERRDVLVVPGVPVGDRGAVGNAGDLVAVVPPGHHARVLRRLVAQPPVGLAVVVHHHLLPSVCLGFEHDLRLREPLGQLVRVVVKFAPPRHAPVHRVRAERDPQQTRDRIGVDQLHALHCQRAERARVQPRLAQRRLGLGAALAALLAPLLGRRRHVLAAPILLLLLLLRALRRGGLGGGGGARRRQPQDHRAESRDGADEQLVGGDTEEHAAEGRSDRAEQDDEPRHLV